MGNGLSNLINFDLLKEMQKEGATIIHTMDENEKVLILGTVVAEKESEKINKMLSKNDYEKDRYIFLLKNIRWFITYLSISSRIFRIRLWFIERWIYSNWFIQVDVCLSDVHYAPQ